MWGSDRRCELLRFEFARSHSRNEPFVVDRVNDSDCVDDGVHVDDLLDIDDDHDVSPHGHTDVQRSASPSR